MQDFDIAVRLLEPIRPTFGVVTDRGKSHREMGNLELAIKDFGTALARRPNDIQLMLLQVSTELDTLRYKPICTPW